VGSSVIPIVLTNTEKNIENPRMMYLNKTFFIPFFEK